MSNTSAISRSVRVPILVSVTLAAICVGGACVAPASAAQNAEACGGAPSRALGIDEIVAQRKAQMATDGVAFALALARAGYGRN